MNKEKFYKTIFIFFSTKSWQEQIKDELLQKKVHNKNKQKG
jgi:hypothetical protein